MMTFSAAQNALETSRAVSFLSFSFDEYWADVLGAFVICGIGSWGFPPGINRRGCSGNAFENGKALVKVDVGWSKWTNRICES